MDNITSLVITAIIGTIGILKFKFIEEFVKKITSDDGKARGYSIILLLFTLIVVFTALSWSLESPPSSNPIVQKPAEVAELQPAIPKTDLEVKVETAKEAIVMTEDLIQQAKENKRIKDSTFAANRGERWVYQIGDWTNDNDKILQMHKQLQITENVKVVKQKKNYLFIKEDNLSKEDLEAELDQLKSDLQGISVKVIDLNNFLTRRKDNFVERIETFGRRKRKIEVECLVVD
jgi:hypothetical protein